MNFGEYFYKNPHQLGLVTYDCFLLLFSKEVNFVFFTNLLWILIANFAVWQTVRLLYPEKENIRKIVILLSFAFLPQFFYLFYAYGQVPLVRQNYAVAGIAILLIYFLNALQKKRWIYTAACLGVLCSILLPGKLVTAYYENAASTDLQNGMPAVLYVAMGLQEGDDIWRASGWYNSFNDDTYLENNCNVEISSQIAMDSIKSRLDTFIRNPAYTVEFFGEKLITTWCEPTYQSIWSGPMISMGNHTEAAMLHELYSGGRSFGLLSSVMNVISAWLICLQRYLLHGRFGRIRHR